MYYSQWYQIVLGTCLRDGVVGDALSWVRIRA